MKIFFDTSAYAKRFLKEQGSEQVLHISQNARSVSLSVICTPELTSAFCRLLREAKINDSQYLHLRNSVEAEMKLIEVIALDQEVIKLTHHLLEKNTLRAMDAIHIASAVIWQPDYFVSADRQQLTAAKKAGLKFMPV